MPGAGKSAEAPRMRCTFECKFWKEFSLYAENVCHIGGLRCIRILSFRSHLVSCGYNSVPRLALIFLYDTVIPKICGVKLFLSEHFASAEKVPAVFKDESRLVAETHSNDGKQ